MTYEKAVSRRGLTKEEWLAHRRSGICASDAGAIAGLNPYSTGYSVWMDKLGEAEPIAETEAMRQGTELEEYVAKRFCERTGKRVKRCEYILRSKAYPFMLADGTDNYRSLNKQTGTMRALAPAISFRTGGGRSTRTGSKQTAHDGRRIQPLCRKRGVSFKVFQWGTADGSKPRRTGADGHGDRPHGARYGQYSQILQRRGAGLRARRPSAYGHHERPARVGGKPFVRAT